MKKFLKEVLSSSVYILVVLLLTFLVVKFVAVRTEVVGPSMETTLYKKENAGCADYCSTTGGVLPFLL